MPSDEVLSRDVVLAGGGIGLRPPEVEPAVAFGTLDGSRGI